jgi:hypothetical protein
MADENMTPDAGDPGETMNMGSGDMAGAETEPKPEKKPGDWVTVEMPKVQKPAPASPPPASQPPASPPPMKVPDAERTVLEGSGTPSSMGGSKAQPTPGASEGYSMNPPVIESAPASGGMAWMEGIGIKDPGTQKIVLFGGGGALLLCCLCSCILTVVTVVLPMMSTAP